MAKTTAKSVPVTQLPPLYKRGKSGKILHWVIRAEGELIVTVQKTGASGKPQRHEERINQGKNLGRANETTAVAQAAKEAHSRWEKKLKAGYVRTAAEAAAGGVDEEYIEGGVAPMLALKYEDRQDRIKYPVFVQPKLDGMRATFDGKGFFSRNRRPLGISVQHILDELKSLGITAKLDGELYNHEMREEFEELISRAKRTKEPHEDFRAIQYHVYDIIDESMSQEERLDLLGNAIPDDCEYIKVVETEVARSREEATELHALFLESGYEGSMIRDLRAKYCFHRSDSLLKRKEFQDEEFPIVGVKEGRGKMAGKAIFICKAKNGNEFDVKMKGSLKLLENFLSDPSLWKKKFLTVKYMGLTNANGVPRHPVGLRVRDGKE